MSSRRVSTLCAAAGGCHRDATSIRTATRSARCSARRLALRKLGKTDVPEPVGNGARGSAALLSRSCPASTDLVQQPSEVKPRRRISSLSIAVPAIVSASSRRWSSEATVVDQHRSPSRQRQLRRPSTWWLRPRRRRQRSSLLLLRELASSSTATSPRVSTPGSSPTRAGSSTRTRRPETLRLAADLLDLGVEAPADRARGVRIRAVRLPEAARTRARAAPCCSKTERFVYSWITQQRPRRDGRRDRRDGEIDRSRASERRDADVAAMFKEQSGRPLPGEPSLQRHR